MYVNFAILCYSQRARQIKRAEREKKESEELERQSKYPKHVIVNEKAINSQPIAKYQVRYYLWLSYTMSLSMQQTTMS